VKENPWLAKTMGDRVPNWNERVCIRAAVRSSTGGEYYSCICFPVGAKVQGPGPKGLDFQATFQGPEGPCSLRNCYLQL